MFRITLKDLTMASGVAAVPRVPGSPHKGMKTPNLPVIEHPMSKLGNKGDLNIRGSSSMGQRKDNGHGLNLDFGPKISTNGPSAPVSRGRDVGNPSLYKSAPDRIIQWPPVADFSITNSTDSVCDYTAPFTYRRSAAERAGLIPQSHKEEISKRMTDVILPPIENLGEDEYGKSKPSFKLPSLDQIMDLVEDRSKDHLIGPKAATSRGKKSEHSRSQFEVADMVKDKLNTGHNGLRNLFRSNDPTGQGNVTREALLRIIYTVCGYISTDQFNKFLKKIGLEGREPISFDLFVSCFKENEAVKKEWVSPVQRSLTDRGNRKKNPEESLKNTDMLVEDPYFSAPFSDDMFRQKIKTIDDARLVFPAACFELNGMIVPPQLREAYAQLGIYMVNRDFDTLWKRYDKEGTGAIFTHRFLKRIGVDTGRPKSLTARDLPMRYQKLKEEVKSRPRSEAMGVNPKNEVNSLTETNANEPQDKPASAENKINVEVFMTTDIQEQAASRKDDLYTTTQTDEKPVDSAPDKPTKETKTTETPLSTPQSKVRIPKRRKSVKLDNVVDCLHYRFEESYNAMMTAFQLFDYLSDNYISRIDFRRCLQEFGFNVTVTELDNFLARIGIRSIRGQLNYKEFLAKFQSKAENSITNRTVTNQYHMFQTDTLPGSQGGLTAEELEAKLVEYFHGDFIKLISYFRSCDKYNLSVITPHEFRCGIERRLGYQISEKQWDQLHSDVGQDGDGLIPYHKFLQMFDVIPGSWNRRMEDGMAVVQVSGNDMSHVPELDKLREKAKVHMVPHEVEKPKSDVRTVEDIQLLLDDLFNTKFHTFDKHFKEMDRKMTGRMSKWQFGALVKLCGLTLTQPEMDKMWLSLNVADDGMYSYNSLLKNFVNLKSTTAERKEIVTQSDNTKELIEEAKRVQRERREKRKAKQQEVAKPPQSRGPPSRTASAASFPPPPPSAPASIMSTKSVRTKELLVKVKENVINNWEGLKSVFKFIDRNGFANITMKEMLDIMDSMNFCLTSDEKKELCQRFDLQRNGRFHYLEFMKCYSQRPENSERAKSFVYSKHTHTLTKKQRNGSTITVARVLSEMRDKLMAENSNLRRAFKKLDISRNGYLSVGDFRRALKSCNVEVSNEDFYHLMSEFDCNLTGRISYDNFLGTFIDV
ncbi:EF-hand calcium-binding domain-containing protein 6-like isoform X3 [Mizuhopecten yessoensis]|uniref:EF-hand calcium-binding domain-containing protein 6-like isoform X3 n=1 Tax=Mizuhopecten yessoensis TaxID=6573 RepID=UPI000B457535|nr:EF-hand calcium-binding domain-containing protein 6-like isoform X3 [Mizuhopecten yessoensis]